MASVYIVFGFTEGRWHGKKFRRQLKRRGYNLARKLHAADVVIGHSGGCFDIPPLRDSQTLMLINPPYWPDRSLVERGSNMIGQIARSLTPNRYMVFHVNKTLHNGVYFVTHRRKNRSMARRARTFDLEQEVSHARTILVRNNDDPWLTPDLQLLQKNNPHLHLARLPGEHDDCWLNPSPYIDILEAYQS